MSQAKDFQEAMKNFKKAAGGGGGGPKLPGIKMIAFFVFLLLGVWGFFSLYYTVQPDEEAVILRLGKYYNTYPPGLHFKLPFGIDRMIIVKTTYVHTMEFGFRSGRTRGTRTSYSGGNFDKESLMLTGDLNIADVEWVVQYQISDPFKYLFKASNPKQNIRDVSESIMRRVVGDRLVTEVLTTGRVEIAAQAKVLMQETLNKYDIGVRVTAVKLQDVNPPESVKPSFNEVNEAKQEQEKLITEAERIYNKVIPEARGKASEVIARAEGYAEALVNRSQGDAEKFSAMLQAYKRAPSITRKRIYIETMEELFEKFEKITIVDPKIKGLLPVFNSLNKAE